MVWTLAVLTGFVFLFVLLADIVVKGSPAFTQHYIKVDMIFDPSNWVSIESHHAKKLPSADYGAVVKSSLRAMFPDVSSRSDKKQLYRLISIGAEYSLRDMVIEDPDLIGSTQEVWLLAHSEAGSYLKGQVEAATRDQGAR